MIGEYIAFWAIATLILGGGILTVTAKRTFHSALFLGVVLVAVAALFISLNSPFLGTVQILVYVGGILTLLLFAVMFVAGDEEEEL